MFGRASVFLPALGLRPATPSPQLATFPAACHRLTPLLATLGRALQIAEKSAALSPLFATLTQPFTPKSCICHSYEKQGGWGVLQVGSAASMLLLAEPQLRSPRQPSRTNGTKSFVLIFFRTLLHVSKRYPFSFQHLPHSSRKNTRVGGTLSLASRHSFTPSFEGPLTTSAHETWICIFGQALALAVDCQLSTVNFLP
jgi:hypothetical protein